MGKGLQPCSTGLHIAFAAGTGVLAFIDLVAYLARQTLNIKSGDGQDMQLAPGFKLILYASFASEEEAVGLHLLRAASDAHGDRFELRLRLSNGNQDAGAKRWDSRYLDEELGKLQEHPVKIWVCGTPAMNQVFEAAREELQAKHPFLTPDVFEVL